MADLTLTVEPVLGGWVVRHGRWTSPILTGEQALDLARGMADALNAAGDTARVCVWGRED